MQQDSWARHLTTQTPCNKSEFCRPATLHVASRPYSRAMREVTVSLGARSYSILIGPNLLSQLGRQCSALKLGRTCAIISDTTVAKHYAAAAEKSLRAAGFDPIRVVV